MLRHCLRFLHRLMKKQLTSISKLYYFNFTYIIKMRFYFSILLLFTIHFCLAQGKVTFEANIDAKEVVEGNTFEVSFTLKNANGSSFQPPSFKPLKVVSGPNRSISNSIMNGKVSSEMTISYMLLAEKQGNFVIKSAKVKANNKQLLSKPIQVKVVKARKIAPGVTGGEPIFVIAEFSDSVAYVGQQVLLDYKIYTKKNIESFNLISESDFDGLFNMQIRRYNNQATKVALNGEQYVTQIIHRVALFPQQTGEYNISPMGIRVGVNEGGQRRRRSLFFSNHLKYQNLRSKPATLKVIPLPAGAPDDFCGAIGNYQMTAGVSPSTLTTDDAVSVKMSIRGNGDGRQVIPTNFDWPDGFDVYDPKVGEEDTGENGGEIQHVKEVEFVALPTAAGQYMIKPSMSYFDTDSAKYITLAINPMNIVVRPGTNKPGRTNISPRDANAEEMMRPIKTTTRLKSFGKPFFGSLIYWLLFALPILVFGFLFYKNKKDAERGDIDPLEQKRIKAQRVAQKKLATAKGFLDQNKSGQFYDEIANATLGYVGDKLNIPLSKMSKSNVEEKLNSLKVEASLITRFMVILKTTEMARFGGGGNVDAMQKIYSETSEVLTEMESAIG